MIKQFHIRYLAKTTAMHKLAISAGFLRQDFQLLVTAEQLENNSSVRRSVVLELIEEGFLYPKPMGQVGYVPTMKALNDCSRDEYVGELNIGTASKHLATWLSAEMMKAAIEDLSMDRAVIKDTPKGKVVIGYLGARSDEQIAFDRRLSCTIGAIAKATGHLSTSASEFIKLPAGALHSETLRTQLDVIRKDARKEANRLLRESDAIAALITNVQDSCGWDGFVQKARDFFEGRNV